MSVVSSDFRNLKVIKNGYNRDLISGSKETFQGLVQINLHLRWLSQKDLQHTLQIIYCRIPADLSVSIVLSLLKANYLLPIGKSLVKNILGKLTNDQG